MKDLHSVPELNYLTQIVFLLFEDTSKPENSDLRYRVNIHFSAGVRCRDGLAETSDAKKNSPELTGKLVKSPFVKRLPPTPLETPLGTTSNKNRKLSEPFLYMCAKKAETKELVVQRKSIDNQHVLKLFRAPLGRRKSIFLHHTAMEE